MFLLKIRSIYERYFKRYFKPLHLLTISFKFRFGILSGNCSTPTCRCHHFYLCPYWRSSSLQYFRLALLRLNRVRSLSRMLLLLTSLVSHYHPYQTLSKFCSLFLLRFNPNLRHCMMLEVPFHFFFFCAYFNSKNFLLNPCKLLPFLTIRILTNF